ncbi:MAG: host attachment protein [Burkholderiales bacterium]|nr:host attachment protein [Burkholderiales bacterium]
MKTRTEWILVANAAQARILQRTDGGRLELVHTFSHPASRRKASELGDDKAGREMAPQGWGGAAFEPRTDAKRKEHVRFANELAQVIGQAAQAGSFDSLAVFASNPFLGEVTRALGHAGHGLPVETHGVDLSSVGIVELAGRMDAVRARQGVAGTPPGR